MTETLLSNIIVKKYVEPINRIDLLKSLAEIALHEEWARPGYINAVLSREEKYPTGLHTRGVEIAIPHADPEWTILPGMVVGILSEPTGFEPMGGEGDEVKARFIFLLLIPDAESHIDFLQTLAEFIENEDRLKTLGETNDIKPLLDFFKQKLEV